MAETPQRSTTALQPNEDGSAPTKGSKKKLIFGIAAGALIVVFLAVFLPVYFVVIKKPSTTSSSSSSATAGNSGHTSSHSSSSAAPSATPSAVAITGGDGSIVTMENGTTFTYRNSFGGHWYHDPQDPFSLNARANSYTPPLNQTWRWGVDRVYGVNLGGWLVMEPFISPAPFQRYGDATDEYVLSQRMAADTANGGLQQIIEHYETFITEKDIADIAAAGLNWLRIPLGYWALDTWDDEPFVAKTSWTYFLKAVEWARKYGLRIELDLHAVPGSQNGLNHSGKLGTINFLEGTMGVANAERTLDYLRVLAQYISQPQYKDVICAIGLVNEPLVSSIGYDSLHSFNLRAYDIIREVTGFGEGNGPYIAIQDGLQSVMSWNPLLPGGDRVIMDGHAYFAFGEPNEALMTDIAEDGLPGGTWPAQACSVWGPLYSDSRNTIGPTFCGEFSAAPNDCGLFIRSPGIESYHPQCALYNNWENYSPAMKAGLQEWVKASFDAFGDFFFWTWKIGPSTAGRVEAPLWSYSLGLQEGWIPRDPRESIGKCARVLNPVPAFNGAFAPARTGAAPSPTIDAAYRAEYPWPPTSVRRGGPGAALPTYTNTAPQLRLPVPTFTGAPASATAGLDGWANESDTTLGIAPVEGIVYPDSYAS